MANGVKNAKSAARKFLAGVVAGVKGKHKGKDAVDKPAASKPDTAPKTAPKTARKDKDTSAGPDVSKGKGKRKKGKDKPADLSEAREDVNVKGKNAKHLSDVSTAKNVLGRGAARAKVFGFAASAVWRAVGFRSRKDGSYYYTVSQCKAMRDGLGLAGVIRDGNVKCQFADGRGRANGNDPLYGGDVPALTAEQWAILEKAGGVK
jgi:hypothetical protein